MERVYRVRTPEMVEFTFPVAGLGSRFLAWLIDTLLLGTFVATTWVVLLLVGAAAAPALGPTSLAGAFAIGLFAAFLLMWGYGVGFEAVWDGRTPGKRVLGLRVIGEAGIRITLAQAAIRNFFRVLDSLPPVTYVVGGLAHLVSPLGQRLGDLVAGTVVVREERRDLPSRIGFPETKYNTLLEDPVVATRIARLVTPAERELFLELLLRREELALATRAELFSRLAKHLALKLELPEGARFLSDEKLVMNVAQVVLERASVLGKKARPAGAREVE